MNHEQFFKTIQAGGLRPVYLFQGGEQFVMRRAIERLKAALLPAGLEELNFARIEGGNAASIIDAAETLPLMCDRRLVVVEDWPPLLPGKSRDEAAEAEKLEAWLARPPETCVLVFNLRVPPDSRKKATVALRRLAEVVDFNELSDADIMKWLNQVLRPLGKSIAPEAAERMVFLAGRSLTMLSQEIEKLAAYSGERPEITVQDVDAMVTPSLEATVFQMIDEFIDGRPLPARRLLKSLLEDGENEVGILAMLARQFRLLTHMRRMSDAGEKLPQIERALQWNHYGATRGMKQAARFPADRLESLYRACVEADYSIKSGQVSGGNALERVLLAIGDLQIGHLEKPSKL